MLKNLKVNILKTIFHIFTYLLIQIYGEALILSINFENSFKKNLSHTKNKIMLSIFLKPFLLLSMPGGSEWILIVLVILLFFGGKKIPDLMRGIGKGVREFNDAKEGMKNELNAGMQDKEATKPNSNSSNK